MTLQKPKVYALGNKITIEADDKSRDFLRANPAVVKWIERMTKCTFVEIQ